MYILITNDDGVDAPGIKALTKVLKSLAGVQVIVVAPHREQSATSHSLTLHRPLRISRKRSGVFAVDGTPTDCVMIGSSRLCERRPDMIISGINRGGNVGDDVHYSGTVAAAIEGGLMGIPAIAVSQLGSESFNYVTAARFTKRLVARLLKKQLPAGIVLNINVPPRARGLSYEITKTGKRNYGDIYVETKDPRGRPYYWIGGNLYSFYNIPGSDGNALNEGKISVTPLNVNMTHTAFIAKLKGWKW